VMLPAIIVTVVGMEGIARRRSALIDALQA
jgi:hypothetical protein